MSATNQTTAAVEVSPVGQATPVPAEAAFTGPRRRSGAWLTQLLGNRKAAFGGLILLAFAAVAIFAPALAPYDPTEFVGRPHRPPSSEFRLGTTGSGQDMLSQLIYGTRISLGAGVIVGVATTVIGALVGLAAGYFRGRVDDFLSLLTNVMLIIPGLPLLVVLAAFLPAGFWTTVMVLIVAGWAWPARVLRSQTLSLREKDFVSSALVSGEGSWRIMLREILPNMMSIVAAGMFGAIIYAIGAQAALEFLGLGNPSAISWGTILYWAGNNAGLLVGAWWTFVPAGLCIALVAFAFALVNYAIDEITNPRLRSQRETNLALRRHRRQLGVSRATPVLRSAGQHRAAGD
ncbi:MAG: ABC transporter permease [Chloroflexia bacterium]|nr:ABC transporter permease [Chloroflexia bacterium]